MREAWPAPAANQGGHQFVLDYSMSSLLLPTAVLLAGSALAAAPAALFGGRAGLKRWAAPAAVAVALLLIASGTGAAPQNVARYSWAGRSAPLILQGNEPGRLLGVALAAAVLAATLVFPRFEGGSDSADREGTPLSSGTECAVLLVALAATLIALLPGNLLSLIVAWAALDGVVVAAWLLLPATEHQRSAALTSWAAGAAGTLFLWAAAVLLPPGYAFGGIRSSTASEGMWVALSLAVLLRLAPFPFHLHRSWVHCGRPGLLVGAVTAAESAGLQRRPEGAPSRDTDVDQEPPASVPWPQLANLMQAASGVWLLARLVGLEEMPVAWRQVVTALLLTGLAGSGVLAWLSENGREAAGWIIAGQAGTVILVGLWAGPDAALAEGGVLILAGSLLILCASLKTAGIAGRVAGCAAVAALGGLPFTRANMGRFLTYGNWLSDSWGLYLLLAAAAHLLFLAAGAKVVFRPLTARPGQMQRMATGIGLGLPAIGLLSWSRGLATGEPLVWLAVLIPAGGGALLAWGGGSARPLQQEVLQRVRPLLRLGWLHQLTGAAISTVGRALCAVRNTLEGEGALFWMVLMLVLGWLVSRSSG